MSSSETPRQTQRLQADQVAEAAHILRAGGLVAFPTETVYGLGGLATNGSSVAGIFAAKGRPSFNPLIVHVANRADAEKIAVFDPMADRLAERFWPGPLTLVLPLRAEHGLSTLVTAGLETVAIRVPSAPIAKALLAATQGPIAAPSANPSGRISATRPDHVLEGLSGKIDAVLDGGPCRVGLESTILAPSPLTLLREGGVSAEDIEAFVGPLLRDMTPGHIQAPGQLASHYAPLRRLRMNVVEHHVDAIKIGFGASSCDLNLSADEDLIMAAACLFDCLHAADHLAESRGLVRIDVAPVPDIGLGRAINDRLQRASAPR